jgi:hypothetical protein
VSEQKHAHLLLRLPWRWTMLLPSDTQRQPIISATAVLLSFVTYLLTLPRKTCEIMICWIWRRINTCKLLTQCKSTQGRKSVTVAIKLYRPQTAAATLTWAIGSSFGTSARVHRRKLPIKNKSKPSIAAVRQFEGCRIRPDVETVTAATYAPVSPVVSFTRQHLLSII